MRFRLGFDQIIKILSLEEPMREVRKPLFSFFLDLKYYF